MSKKRIEDVINEAFVGDTQKEPRTNALDFIAYLRANEMEIPLGDLETFIWEIKQKNELVCFFELSDEYWGIMSDQVPGTWITWSDCEDNGEQGNLAIDERIKEIVWANVKICEDVKPGAEPCGGNCSPGRRKKILGKEFDSLCASALSFDNPSGEILECVKKMVDARKNDILRNIKT